jgi:O-antigen/teichoic acid export membrane protein
MSASGVNVDAQTPVKRRMRVPAHLWVTFTNWGSRAVSMGVQLVSLPVLVRTLGPNEFAAYAVLTSLLAWYQLADLGFGNSAQNSIVAAQTRHQDSKTLIASACAVGLAVLVIGAALLVPLSFLLDYALLRKFQLPAAAHPVLTIWLSGVFFLGSMLGVLSQKILYAIRRGVLGNLITALPSVVFLVLLQTYAKNSEPQLRFLACTISYTAPLGVIGIAVATTLAVRSGGLGQKGLFAACRTLWAKAKYFWLLAVLSAAVLNIDYIVMSQVLKPEQIAIYNVLYRFFWVAVTLYTGLLTATWPVFAEYGVKKEWGRMASYVRGYIAVGLAMVVLMTAALAVATPWLLPILAPGLHLDVGLMTFVLFGTYIGLRIWTDTYTVALQALGDVSNPLMWAPIQAVINAGAQIFFSRIFGLNGILLALVVSFCATVVWAFPLRLNRHWRNDSKLSHGH